jgi:hypothetical protein
VQKDGAGRAGKKQNKKKIVSQVVSEMKEDCQYSRSKCSKLTEPI